MFVQIISELVEAWQCGHKPHECVPADQGGAEEVQSKGKREERTGGVWHGEEGIYPKARKQELEGGEGKICCCCEGGRESFRMCNCIERCLPMYGVSYVSALSSVCPCMSSVKLKQQKPPW